MPKRVHDKHAVLSCFILAVSARCCLKVRGPVGLAVSNNTGMRGGGAVQSAPHGPLLSSTAMGILGDARRQAQGPGQKPTTTHLPR